MPEKPKSRLMPAVVVGVVLSYIAIRILGDRLNSDQQLGCLVVGVFMLGLSLLAFFLGALPFKAAGKSDKTIRRAFIVACLSLGYSLLQIPLWCCMTHQFPPGTMSETQAGLATVGVVISLFGPAAPMIVRIGRAIRERNKQQAQALRRKKSGRDEF